MKLCQCKNVAALAAVLLSLGVEVQGQMMSDNSTSPTAPPAIDDNTTSATTSPVIDNTTSPTSDNITFPTTAPTIDNTTSPTSFPTIENTTSPTPFPTIGNTTSPTTSPVIDNTTSPTTSPVIDNTTSPTTSPVIENVTSPTTSNAIDNTTSPPTINLIVSRNYRQYPSLDATQRCTSCEITDECVEASLEFLPEGQCMTAFSRQMSSKTIVDDDGFICTKQYTDRNCTTLDEVANDNIGCAERYRPGLCNLDRASELFVLEDYCIESSEPQGEYTTPLVEWNSYERQDWCDSRFPLAPANHFRPSDPNICLPSISVVVDDEAIGNVSVAAGSMTQHCVANRLVVTQYSDSNCLVQNVSELVALDRTRGACEKDSIFDYYSTTECAVPKQYHCKNFTDTDFVTTVPEVNEHPEEEHEFLDMYLYAGWFQYTLELDDRISAQRCEQCEEGDGCLRNQPTLLMEDQCVNLMNTDTSAKYFTTEDGNICRLLYEDRDCSIEIPEANSRQGGCHLLRQPGACSSTGELTTLSNFCIRSNVPVDEFIVPVPEFRIYPTLQDCERQNDSVSATSLAYSYDNVCKETAAITDSGTFIAGGEISSCRPEDNSYFIDLYSDKDCTMKDSLKYSNVTFSNGCSLDPVNGVYRRLNCGEEQIYCGEGIAGLIPYFFEL